MEGDRKIIPNIPKEIGHQILRLTGPWFLLIHGRFVNTIWREISTELLVKEYLEKLCFLLAENRELKTINLKKMMFSKISGRPYNECSILTPNNTETLRYEQYFLKKSKPIFWRDLWNSIKEAWRDDIYKYRVKERYPSQNICRFFERGYCRHGNECKYVHRDKEVLRSLQQETENQQPHFTNEQKELITLLLFIGRYCEEIRTTECDTENFSNGQIYHNDILYLIIRPDWMVKIEYNFGCY